MRPELRAHAARQGGLVTRRQAIDVGYTSRELRTMTAVHGPWVVVRRGVYAERDLLDTLDRYDGEARLKDRAAHLSVGVPHLMSHDSAARALGLPLLRPRFALSHLTRTGVGGSRTEHGVKHHLTRLGLLNTETVDGMPVTGLARTAVDLAREHGFETGTVACDSALRAGVSVADLAAELTLMHCWPGVTKARAAVDHTRPGAESPGETLLRLLLVELDIGPPETQFPVRLGDRVAWTDLRVGCHVFEFDGRVKYRSRENGGISDRVIEDVLWDERTRQQAICALGLGMSRVCWDDLFGRARTATAERLRAEYAVTATRFGTVLPEHLRQDAIRIREGQPRN